MNDWPPDSVLSKGTTHSVRGSVNKKKKDGKKVDTLFFGIGVPIHTADCTKMVLFSVWWAGRKAVAVLAVVSK